MRSSWLAFAAAATLIPAPASAQTLRANDPEAFRQAMIAAGYDADIYSSDQGSARINAHLRGATGSFNVDFGPCENDDGTADNCQAAHFSLPYTVDSVPALRAAWNRSHGQPAGQAIAYGEHGYTDQVSIAMEMEVEIPTAGLPRADLLAKLRSWQAMFDVFERMMAQAAP